MSTPPLVVRPEDLDAPLVVRPEELDQPAAKTQTAPPPAQKPAAEQPNALQRFSEVTTGTQHPLAEVQKEAKDIYAHPIEGAKSLGEVFGLPRELWTNPKEEWKNIGSTGIPGMVFGEHGLIKHPLEFGENFTGATKAAEDWSNKNYAAIPGDIAGGIANLALAKEPIRAGTDVAAEGVGRIGEAANKALEPRRLEKGTEKVTAALDTPPGKGGARAASMDRAIVDARNDLAELQRGAPGKGKGAEAFHDFVEKVEDRQQQMWDEGHKPGIERHGETPIDPNRLVAAGRRALTREARDAAPQEAAAAEKWLAGMGDERNLKSADRLIREINDDLRGKDVGTRYGPLQIRVKQAVVKSLRDEVDRVLDASGEQGVREVNRRWGALDEIKNRAAERAVQLARQEAKNGPVPDWVHIYTFLHPGMGVLPTVGAGIRLSSLLRPNPGKVLNRGLTQLGKTSVTAPFTAEAPEGWRTGIETNPARMLPVGATPADWTDTSGPIPEAERTQPITWTPEMINAVARETPKPPPRVSGEATPIGTVQPIALGPFEPKATYRGPQRPATVQRLPALPETASGGERLPSETVKPMVKPRLTVEEKIKERLPQTEPVKAVEKPAERRTSVRQTTGPDFYRTARMNELRKIVAEESTPAEDRDLARRQLEDMTAHPFEKHEGGDINAIRATAERRGETKVLPGMEGDVAKQAEGAARVKGEELTAEMNKPRSVEEAAGRMETLSPLFRGTAASPQGELLKPMEKPAVTEPEEEAEPAEIKGVTEPIKEKPTQKREALPDVQRKYSRDEITDAEGLIQQEIGMMQSADRPGRYFDESEAGDVRIGSRQIRGGDWRAVTGGRNMFPFLREHPDWTPAQLEKALRNKDSALYKRAIDSAAQFNRRQKMSPEERAAAGESIAEKWKGFQPQPSKFLKTD